MSEHRPPKFDFMPRPRTYGRLDISAELIVCSVMNGRLVPRHYPESWQSAVNLVGTAEEHARQRAHADETRTKEYEEEWRRANSKRKYFYPEPYPVPMLLMGLNEARDGYEIVLDPHNIGGEVDPMMLLNFRRKV